MSDLVRQAVIDTFAQILAEKHPGTRWVEAREPTTAEVEQLAANPNSTGSRRGNRYGRGV